MVVAIYGPTASGKSAVAIALASLIDGEVISADSMQVYRGLARLTNQPTPEERQGVPHHLVGHVDPTETYDVVRFAREAHAAIDDVLARGRVPIVAGGSGLYLRAALADVKFPPSVPAAVRERLRADVAALGPEAAHERLRGIDPAAADRIEVNDTRRVVRALELAEVGASLAPADDALWTATMRRPTTLFGLQVDRDVIRARIGERTPRLLEAGGIAEVELLLARGRPLSATAERAHGVPDVVALLTGDIDRAACVERLTARTRQYAKRQDTWLRRLHHATLIDANRPVDAVAADIVGLLRS